MVARPSYLRLKRIYLHFMALWGERGDSTRMNTNTTRAQNIRWNVLYFMPFTEAATTVTNNIKCIVHSIIFFLLLLVGVFLCSHSSMSHTISGYSKCIISFVLFFVMECCRYFANKTRWLCTFGSHSWMPVRMFLHQKSSRKYLTQHGTHNKCTVL